MTYFHGLLDQETGASAEMIAAQFSGKISRASGRVGLGSFCPCPARRRAATVQPSLDAAHFDNCLGALATAQGTIRRRIFVMLESRKAAVIQTYRRTGAEENMSSGTDVFVFATTHLTGFHRAENLRWGVLAS
jgi:hypothetical protein